MPAEVNVPLTTYERLEKYKNEFTNALRHPDSPEWFSKEVNEKLKKDLLWAAPYDARFPQVHLMYTPENFFQDLYGGSRQTRVGDACTVNSRGQEVGLRAGTLVVCCTYRGGEKS
ncbi:hypothetical protein Y032_0266g724 [Ancylostoma ceylanicum]|uniref:Uncharacterized protein n=1 Tax=Ancylostoma ceylanicum TaxID=53326 RepID=A0A016SA32_9BILA|nr:hypothetical protein Y032_0266g724 [Ancylostoma ceylanicum]